MCPIRPHKDVPETIVDLLRKGIEANKADNFRQGNLVSLPRDCNLVITGDIHGHRRNFERIKTFTALAANPKRHIVLQEIIHGGDEDSQRGCLSFNLLFDVIRYKLQFPQRVHIIMGNHDVALISQSKVMKNGREMNASMNSALNGQFGRDSEAVDSAIRHFLFSQPLAVRCDNRIWLSHSLPANRYADKFDERIFHRQLKTDDLTRPGSAYLLTWGRQHNQQTLDKLTRLFNVDIFILGHQHNQQQGFRQAGQNLLIITSDHNHGCLLPIDLAQSYTMEQLIDSIVPLASIG